ncbi:family 20 glycosylhydrolase [Histomonas meleagridis]|uniref:family 20 glycosylhydrolase n=1 Tax=Histomonas meleagridis TaxID=135588 RepID=UPI003559DA0C|nr:family 20 glycosylhydrolase [Histomonas meleagridis]KAH0805492.1 family 20 glycosylhydrolase [Histomonas meleagridis]
MIVWNPGQGTQEYAKKKWNISQTLVGPGVYEVAFICMTQNHILDINGIKIKCNGKEIATDPHHGVAGITNNGNSYRVSINQFHQPTFLIANLKSRGGHNPYVRIQIKCIEFNGLGWSSGQIQKEYLDHQWDITKYFNGPGDYEIKFKSTQGSYCLDIKSVKIINHGNLISQDVHDGYTGNTDANNYYYVQIYPIPHTPIYLKASVSCNGDDSNGKIIVHKVSK